jgi:hypothetical protein
MSAVEEAPVGDPIGVKGMFRVHIENPETGEIVGDSGWHENLITNVGFQNFLSALLGKTTGSIQVTHMSLGTGGAPVATDTTLAGEALGTGSVPIRQAVTVAVNSSKTVQFTGTFSSSNSFVSTTQNISNIGLFGTSSSGTLFAGNTYSSSSCATNQNVNCTYSIAFS